MLLPDDSWVNGAEFRLWISPGADRKLYELPLTQSVTIPAKENGNTEYVFATATNWARQLLGRPPYTRTRCGLLPAPADRIPDGTAPARPRRVCRRPRAFGLSRSSARAP